MHHQQTKQSRRREKDFPEEEEGEFIIPLQGSLQKQTNFDKRNGITMAILKRMVLDLSETPRLH